MRFSTRSIRPLTALVSCALLAGGLVVSSSSPAGAEPLRYKFIGSGWGHGIGMSQWGAKGFADAGTSYGDILRHYYQGTAVQTVTLPSSIRIGVLQDRDSIRVTSSGTFRFTHPEIPGGGVEVPANQTWTVVTDTQGRFVVRRADGSTHAAVGNNPPLYIDYEPYSNSILRLPDAGHRYRWGRGEINTYSTSGGQRLRAILVMPFERYLYGLGEMPSSWHMEALKAQAVAGRTYALDKVRRVGQNRSPCNCALYSTVVDQAYIGYDKESESARWPQAVDATAGVVSTSGGTPIQAYYSSASGGHTEHNENVWGGSALSYLRGVPDPHERSPHDDWEVTFTAAELSAKLNSRSSTAVGNVHDVVIVPPLGVSGRPTVVKSDSQGGVRLTGSGGTKRVSGDTLRSVLGLKSTLFRIDKDIRHPPGTAVQVPGSPAVWWLDDLGRRQVITSENQLRSLGVRWTDVVRISGEELGTYPGQTMPAPEGTLISVPPGTVYLVSDGTKRPFPSAQTFESMGYDWDAIINVSTAEGAQLRGGPQMAAGTRHPNGTLVSGSGAGVYLLEGGSKRPITSAGVFESRYRWTQVVEISDSELGLYPDGPALGFRDGTLIKSPQGAVYVISDGRKHGFPSASVFNSLGYSWDAIRNASSGEMTLNGDGPNVAASGRHLAGTAVRGGGVVWWLDSQGRRQHITSGAIQTALGVRPVEVVNISDGETGSYAMLSASYPDGTLISIPPGTVYLVSDGRKRPFPSAQVFEGMGYRWNAVLGATAAEGAQLPTGAVMAQGSTHPSGTLVKGSGGGVYLLEGGRRRPIISGAIYESRYSWNQIVTISDSELNGYADGAAVGFREGALIQNPQGTVYVVSQGTKRPFPSAQVFEGMGYRWDAIRKVGAGEAGIHPTGPVMG